MPYLLAKLMLVVGSGVSTPECRPESRAPCQTKTRGWRYASCFLNYSLSLVRFLSCNDVEPEYGLARDLLDVGIWVAKTKIWLLIFVGLRLAFSNAPFHATN